MSRMTFKKALSIVIESAARDIRGQGLGYRTTSEESRQEVAAAIEILWPKAHGYELDDSARYNMGLPARDLRTLS